MFKDIKKQLQEQFKLMQEQSVLFVTDVDKELLWTTYLDSFAPDEKQEHNCNACRSFIRQYGNIVAIINDRTVSLWDFLALD